jgi:hypothetical protein
MNRIETIAPEIVDLIDRASLLLRHKILVGVCATAIEGSGIEHDIVSSMFNEFQRNGVILARMRKILQELANEFDEKYFDFQDSGEGELALQRFRQARAIAALAFAGDNSNKTSALDAIYEAAMAVSDSQIVIDKVHAISSTQ